MAQQFLTLATLPLVDNGSAAEAFNEYIRQAAKDCDDRPGLDKDRTVTLAVKMRPRHAGNNALDSIDVEIEITSKGPGQKTLAHRMDVKAGGSVVFHPDDRNDPSSNPLPFNGE